MSRIGRAPIAIPEGVEVRLEPGALIAKGKGGQRRYELPGLVEVVAEGKELRVEPKAKSKQARQLWGTTRANLARLVAGLEKPFERKLEIDGVGFRAAVQGRKVVLQLGFSHEVVYEIPEGVEVKAAKPTELVVSGADYRLVGQVASEIRAFRVPDPYKAKGIRHEGEYIRRKEGKKK